MKLSSLPEFCPLEAKSTHKNLEKKNGLIIVSPPEAFFEGKFGLTWWCSRVTPVSVLRTNPGGGALEKPCAGLGFEMALAACRDLCCFSLCLLIYWFGGHPQLHEGLGWELGSPADKACALALPLRPSSGRFSKNEALDLGSVLTPGCSPGNLTAAGGKRKA